MCILSFIQKNNGDFILTHNRDEDETRRTASQLSHKTIAEQAAVFPQDLRAGGTWILQSDTYVTSILNGAFEKHKYQPPYARSRGLFPFDLLSYDSAEEYVEQISLEGVEPFSQFILAHGKPYMMVWDGKKKWFRRIEKNVFIYSSATLYGAEKQEANKQAIHDALLVNQSPAHLLEVHERIKMNLGDVHPLIRTTSITQIVKRGEETKMAYKILDRPQGTNQL